MSLNFSLGIFLFLLLFSGCSERISNPDSYIENSIRVAVPWIKGDTNGELTSIIKSHIADHSFQWEYEPSKDRADYVIYLTLLSEEKNPLGYRYDHPVWTDVKVDRLIQDEARKTIVLEGKLCQNNDLTPIVPPFRVEGNCDYDYINSHSFVDAAFINAEGDVRIGTRVFFRPA